MNMLQSFRGIVQIDYSEGGRYKSVSHWVWACHIRSLMAPNGGSYRDNVLQSHQRVQLGIRFAGDVLMQYCGRYHSCQENILIYLKSRVRDWSLFESWSLSAYQLVEPRPSYGSRLGPKIVWSMIEWTCLLWGSQLLVFRGSCWFYYWQQHRFCRMQRGYCFHSMPVSSGSFEVFHVGENTSNQHKCSPTPSLLVKYHEISALFHRRNDFDWLHHRKLIDYLHASLALSLSLSVFVFI